MKNPAAYAKLRFVGLESGRGITAMFNPNQVSISHGYAHGRHVVPGRSHPLYGGGAGNAETIELTLYLDGDRGRSDGRQRFEGIDVFDQPNAPKLDVMSEIRVYQSMVLPHDAAKDGSYGVPEEYLVQWGTILNAKVLVTNVGVNVTEMTPQGGALRATVTLSMEVVEYRNRTTWLFLNDDGEDFDGTPQLEVRHGTQR